MDLEQDVFGDNDEFAEVEAELRSMTADQIVQRGRLLDNEIRVLKVH